TGILDVNGASTLAGTVTLGAAADRFRNTLSVSGTCNFGNGANQVDGASSVSGSLTLGTGADHFLSSVTVTTTGTLTLGTGANQIDGLLQVDGSGTVPGAPALTLGGNLQGSHSTALTLGAVTFNNSTTLSMSVATFVQVASVTITGTLTDTSHDLRD